MNVRNSVWQFSTAGNLRFGRGCRTQIVDILGKLQLSRPLVVTDKNLFGLPIAEQFMEHLEACCNPTAFVEGRAEPSVAVAEQAIAMGQSAKVDCVIGIGGGSNMDVAKVAATVLTHQGAPKQYFGFDRVPGPTMPLFAIPTTAGTGSEVSHSAVLTDEEENIKVSTLSPWLRPTYALVDPEFTDSCPRRVTAESGIDALVHAIEAYTNKDFSLMVGVDAEARAYEGSYPLTRLLAAEAIRLVGRSLVTACDNPTAESRDDMALAATLAGMAFSNSGVGIVHALEYPIGALTHCGHGEGNGLLLPHVMRYNQQSCASQLAEVAVYLGMDAEHSIDLEVASAACIDKVVSLQKAVGIRTRLRDLGLAREAIDAVATKAFEIKRLMDLNVRRPSKDDLVSILEAAF